MSALVGDEAIGWICLIVGGLMLSGRATTFAAALIGLVRRWRLATVLASLAPLIVPPLSGGAKGKAPAGEDRGLTDRRQGIGECLNAAEDRL